MYHISIDLGEAGATSLSKTVVNLCIKNGGVIIQRHDLHANEFTHVCGNSDLASFLLDGREIVGGSFHKENTDEVISIMVMHCHTRARIVRAHRVWCW